MPISRSWTGMAVSSSNCKRNRERTGALAGRLTPVKILFASFRDGNWNLWWIDRETKVQRKLTDYSSLATYVRYPSWSPRADSIVFEHSTTRGNIFVVDLKPGS